VKLLTGRQRHRNGPTIRSSNLERRRRIRGEPPRSFAHNVDIGVNYVLDQQAILIRKGTGIAATIAARIDDF